MNCDHDHMISSDLYDNSLTDTIHCFKFDLIMLFVLSLREVHQIRWLSFMEALEAVVLTLDALMTYFTSTAAKDPKSSGMKKRVGTELFITLAHGMLDILGPVIALSLIFQKKDLDIGSVRVRLLEIRN